MHGSNSKNALGTVILLSLMLAACSGGDDNGTPAATGSTSGSSNGSGTGSSTGTTNTGGSTTTTTALSITGAPNRQVIANQPYWFRPIARGGAGTVRFGISNRPQWATFNSTTGEVAGTPSSGDVGIYRGVTVTVTAGTQMRALAFDIEVVQVGTSSVMLSWLAPTENEDGTPLTNLAGYRIHYGLQSGNYSSVVNVDPGLATYILDGLAAGTYYIVLSAVSTSGAESSYSNEAQVDLG